jgi:hypothetical protein
MEYAPQTENSTFEPSSSLEQARPTAERQPPHLENRKGNLTCPLSFGIVAHMKTTIDIADNLFLRSKQVSRERGVTLRELFSEGLAIAIEKWSATPAARVKAVTFKGKGLAPEFQQAPWGVIRNAAYEEHGS